MRPVVFAVRGRSPLRRPVAAESQGTGLNIAPVPDRRWSFVSDRRRLSDRTPIKILGLGFRLERPNQHLNVVAFLADPAVEIEQRKGDYPDR